MPVSGSAVSASGTTWARSTGLRSADGETDRAHRGLSWSLVELAGGWAETSDRLSAEDRAELARLSKKARNARTPSTGGERAKYLARRASLDVSEAGLQLARR
jgi:hypothetical protein